MKKDANRNFWTTPLARSAIRGETVRLPEMLLGYLVGDGIGIYAIKKQIPFQFDTKCFLYMVPLLVGFIFVYNRYGAIANLFMTLLALGIAALLFRKYLAQIGRIFRRVRSSRKTNK